MGYLGSDLNDYHSFQLLEKVVQQIKDDDTGDWIKMKKSLRRLVDIVNKREEEVGIRIKEK